MYLSDLRKFNVFTLKSIQRHLELRKRLGLRTALSMKGEIK